MVISRIRFTREKTQCKAIGNGDLAVKMSDDDPDLDSVLEACGLTQMTALFDRAAFGNCMVRRFSSDEDLVGRGMAEHLVSKI